MTIPRSLAAAVLYVAAGAVSASASPLEDCATSDAAFGRAYQLLAEEADYTAALEAWGAIDLDAMSVSCRAEARELRAICLIGEGREGEVDTLYRATLDEVPAWRPDPFSPGQGLFEVVRRNWRRDHAGPPRVSRLPLRFSSAVGQRPKGVRPLVVASAGDGELAWEASASEPWVRLSKRTGATRAGADTILVTIEPREAAGSAGTWSATVSIDSRPFETVQVPVEVVWTGGGKSLLKNPITWVAVGGAGVLVAVLAGGGGGGDTNPPPADDPELPEPNDPPVRPVFRLGVRW